MLEESSSVITFSISCLGAMATCYMETQERAFFTSHFTRFYILHVIYRSHFTFTTLCLRGKHQGSNPGPPALQAAAPSNVPWLPGSVTNLIFSDIKLEQFASQKAFYE